MHRFIHARMAGWLLVSLALTWVIAVTAPAQLPVSLYKLSLISLAAVVGYWFDRSLFPYARPDSYLERDWRHGTAEPEGDADYRIADGYILPFAVAMLRRAIIVGAAMIGVALGA
ncbi:MAG TPA: putative holin [Paucimonas sp.]|nr:putative holin [Paucimonas sp.]